MIKKIIIPIASVFVFLLLFMMITNYVTSLPIRNLKVLSGSMLPDIRINDVVFIANKDKYHENDIVTYEDGESYVTHRIERIEDDTVILKGDANNTQDKPIKRNQIVGKVFLVIPSAIYLIIKILGILSLVALIWVVF